MGQAAHHVTDADVFHIPELLWRYLPEWLQTNINHPTPHVGTLCIPQFASKDVFMISRYMVLEVVAALLVLFIFVPLAVRIKTGKAPKGRLWNFFETLLLFVRDEIARPTIGGKSADKFLPFLWTMFFFILFCNLLGILPWLGSATGALGTTAVLAGATFLIVIISGMKKYGLIE